MLETDIILLLSTLESRDHEQIMSELVGILSLSGFGNLKLQKTFNHFKLFPYAKCTIYVLK